MKIIKNTFFYLGLSLCGSQLLADDTEVFLADQPNFFPNVLFLLDNSGSMDTTVEGDPQSRSKITVLKDSLGEVLDTMDPNINIGLARFGGANQVTERGISFPVSQLSADATSILTTLNLDDTTSSKAFDVDTDNLPNPSSSTVTVKDYLKEVVNSWSADDYTPIVGSMTEAMQYFKGGSSIYGNSPPSQENAAHPSTYHGAPITTEGAVATYKTPIIDECQSNYLILLSDGAPNDQASAISDRQAKAQSLLGIDSCQDITNAHINTDQYQKGKCGYELANYMATQDLIPTLEGDQHVKTYTIGFGLKDNQAATEYLKIIAEAGQGELHIADSATALAETFNELLNTIKEAPEAAFAAPAYAVNTENGLSHDEQIYVPIVKPDTNKPRWQGNLKRFKLANGVIVNDAGTPMLDAKGNMKPGVNDIWGKNAANDEPDGVISQLEPSKRKLYTNINHTAFDEIKIGNENITKALLSVPTDRYREQVLDYIRGYDVTPITQENCTERDNIEVVDTGLCAKRHSIGDILHSKPVLVAYDDAKKSENYLFFGTNEGFLHAVNAATGKEVFAFMPKQLLQHIDVLFRNSSEDAHPYGLDGPIMVWRKDNNGNGKISYQDGDRVYLYFGMRRGGESYFALDVTQPDQPKLLWTISSSDKDFSEMGQTWSKPTLARMSYKKGNTIENKTVMVVGGGYDPENGDQESRVLRRQAKGQESHQKGRAIYIIDAENGTLIKSFEHKDDSRMNYSITGDIRLMDMNGDQYLDRLYFGDTGGQLWRVDLFSDKSNQKQLNKARLTLLATLGEDTYGSDIDSRKFFFEPDVSLYRDAGKDSVLISLGSGYLSRPKNTDILDSIYVVSDPNPYSLPDKQFKPMTRSDLLDIRKSAATKTKNQGWYYDFESKGEKVLSSPYIFLNKVFFTTFKAGAASAGGDSCSGGVNHQARLYVMDLFDGSAVLDLDEDNKEDLFVKIKEQLIPETPSILFRKPDCSKGEDCKQIIDLMVGIGQPVISSENLAASKGNTNGAFNLDGLLPKLYWINHKQ